jgi:dihydroorotase
MMSRLTLTQPDDWHLHLRDGSQLAATVATTARSFARAIVMPNLKPPITTVEQALAYRQRILAALPLSCNFNPLMTLYLTKNTPVTEITKAYDCEHIFAVKYYPAGATTHSEAGVADWQSVLPVLEAMQHYELPLLIHGEVTTPSVDIFDRERFFLEQVLEPFINSITGTKNGFGTYYYSRSGGLCGEQKWAISSHYHCSSFTYESKCII